MREPTVTVASTTWRHQGATDGKRIIPEETEIAFAYDGGTYAVMIATPQNLEDFALGFSFTERLISSPADIRQLDIVEHDVAEIYGALVPALGRLELAYLHLTHGADEDLAWAIRRDWPSALLLNRPGADIRVRAQDVRGGLTDVITVSSMTLANPDLVERIKVGAPLNTPDPSTFYGGDERGYTDYPTLQPAIA